MEGSRSILCTGDRCSLPNGDATHLVLSQPLGTVVHAWRNAEGLETAVVLGRSPIGQLFCDCIKGVGRLITLIAAEQLELSKMGATHTVPGALRK